MINKMIDKNRIDPGKYVVKIEIKFKNVYTEDFHLKLQTYDQTNKCVIYVLHEILYSNILDTISHDIYHSDDLINIVPPEFGSFKSIFWVNFAAILVAISQASESDLTNAFLEGLTEKNFPEWAAYAGEELRKEFDTFMTEENSELSQGAIEARSKFFRTCKEDEEIESIQFNDKTPIHRDKFDNFIKYEDPSPYEP
ncbi:hypothetical protein ACMA5I_09820 [Paracoccaceae bacterium GXU_MW_L88]